MFKLRRSKHEISIHVAPPTIRSDSTIPNTQIVSVDACNFVCWEQACHGPWRAAGMAGLAVEGDLGANNDEVTGCFPTRSSLESWDAYSIRL